MAKLAVILMMVAIFFIIGPLVVMLGWHLFMTPVFGFQGLSFLQAIGFMLLAGAFKAQIRTS